MFGDKRPYNIALVSVRCQGYTGEMLGSNDLDRVVFKGIDNVDCSTLEDLIAKGEDHPVIVKHGCFTFQNCVSWVRSELLMPLKQRTKTKSSARATLVRFRNSLSL